jgi:hypothetical protein
MSISNFTTEVRWNFFLNARILMMVFSLHATTLEVWAQKYRSSSNKAKGIEINFGGSNMLGDLGGADGSGTNGLKDFDKEAIRSTFGASFIMKVSKSVSVKPNIQFTSLHGSDAYTLDVWRRERNITVNTNVISLATMVELNVPISRTTAFGSGPSIFMSTGLGAIFFNPKAIYNGASYNLHAIGTEGPQAYSRFALNIPLSAGFRYAIDRSNSIGVELQSNNAFTDYLDDVSHTYYDNDKILTDQGEVGAQLADPNLSGRKHRAGDHRGNPREKDIYVLFTLHYRYTIPNGGLF